MPNPSASQNYSVVHFEQGTYSWREWRHAGIGASDAPTVMKENRFASYQDLLFEKVGPIRSNRTSPAMRRGTELEPVARSLYSETTGIEVEPLCLQSTRFAWLRGSLDGISKDHTRAVEIKCGQASYAYTSRENKVPVYYYGQLQHILALTGLQSIDYWSFMPESSPILIAVPRCEEYIARLLAEEQAFWDRVMQEKQKLGFSSL